MGKYMRKAKLAGEVAVMEVSHQSSLGVRTRARTLALQRLQKPAAPTPSPSPPAEHDNISYLQLRSRRLEKPLVVPSRPKDGYKGGPKSATSPKGPTAGKNPNPILTACSANSESVGSVSAAKSRSKRGEWEDELASEASPYSDGIEASFGENFLEFEARDRNVRETTPCSLIKDSDVAGTPGSTTRRRTASGRRTQPAALRSIPTSEEMEEFFAGAEQVQQRIFTEKYNFDPVKDCALPGRYEWVRLDDS
ncbi:unnamed protein product [Spirodela intermedia]|uniref:Cyclin-dependent kinase inhibitor domain-containing protein n=1 Tax=Spirodela intermedia TaxID=51605 RepID=A0A7I8L219_SPIIN|nr:unnamed protein product [Spirodela intermedia]